MPSFLEEHSPKQGNNPPPRQRFRNWRRAIGIVSGAILMLIALLIVSLGLFWARCTAHLPSVDTLKTYHPPLVSRVYSNESTIMAELAAEKRVYVPADAIPDLVKNAFIAAEDQKFYSHKGVDYIAVARASVTNILFRHHKRPLGASTITQQVAKGMLLNHDSEVSIVRKVKEAMLATRMEHVLSKDRILEIYLNGIYLGDGAYGVVAAAKSYFNKSLDELTPAQAALLGSLPKSPSNYNPFLHPDWAMNRRNWVIGRMVETGALTEEEADKARKEPIDPVKTSRSGPMRDGEWFSEEVRRVLINHYGEKQALEGGLDIHTSLDPAIQKATTMALRNGLENYARRKEPLPGPFGTLTLQEDALQALRGKTEADNEFLLQSLKDVHPPVGALDSWRVAVRLAGADPIVAWVEPSVKGAQLKQAWLMGDDLKRGADKLKAGDLILIIPRSKGPVRIAQIPSVQGAAVVMDARTGRVLALSGGWSFEQSQFDRALQAKRQPGSSFKPFVYLAAMEKDISPSQRFEDTPFEQGDWHPQNYEKDNWGALSLHDALRESRNLVTIRVANHVGLESIIEIASRSGLSPNLPPYLSAALGTTETTVLQEAAAYASLANGGHAVQPSFIDYVQSPDGELLDRFIDPAVSISEEGSPEKPPVFRDNRVVVASPQSAYQMQIMMQDVIARGTGFRGKPGLSAYKISGKTGTSQDWRDGWFAGFSPDLVTVVWVGYDTPRSLGENETGGRVAGPIWNEIMRKALPLRGNLDFPQPEGLQLAKYNTGLLEAVDAFKKNQSPGVSVVLHGEGNDMALGEGDTGASLIESLPGAGGKASASTSSNTGAPPVQAETNSSGNPVKDSATLSSGSTPNAVTQPKQESSGDIGFGGLY
ncbi:PBP1A family penicillin-binding protein [Acetobacteraceae bacterium]|nr:PBP1A family penicillin-binding protein [Acetobacteraceae bacterium]